MMKRKITETGEAPNVGRAGAVKRRKPFRVLKILLPHIALNLLIIGYLVAGAWIFQALEKDYDIADLNKKAAKIIRSYEAIEQKLLDTCGSGRLAADGGDWRRKLYAVLSELSSFHEGRKFEINPDNSTDPVELLRPRWNYIEAILYAISVLTTTGYTHTVPMTVQGQIFAVIYGLIGIPLMVLSAVDIGRFLSECVLFVYSKSAVCCNAIMKKLGIRWPSRAVADLKITTRLARSLTLKSETETAVVHKLSVEGEVETTPKPPKKPVKKKKKQDDGRKLPLWVNASILLLFCTVGALCYMAYVEDAPNFFASFFIAFNLVANMTMGELPRVDNIITVLYIVIFVTFGLAVLSMCAELAASELKWVFMEIHYFGRKIGRKRKRGGLEAEVKELLKIINDIRKKYPEKESITTADILACLQYMQENGEMLGSRRRDTIAFMPDRFDAFKFADDFDDPITFHAPSPEGASDDIEMI